MRPTEVKLGGRSVDLLTGRLSDGGQLRPLELRVLQVLAREAPDVVPAPRLLEEAFGYAGGSRSQTLYTTVRRLRLAIEPDPDAPVHVVSHRRVGYRLATSVTAPIGGLPPEPAPIVGQRSVRAALRDGSWRLCTLVGPGGAGKSRLALREAHQLAASGASVTWLAAPTAAALDLLDVGAGVVAVDGADDVLDAVRAAVNRQGEARFLVTSRTPLDLPGEVVVEVGPLDEQDGIDLLVTHAARGRGGRWTPSRESLPVLARIVHLVDGLPYALVLAGLRLAAVSPEVVAAQLEDGSPLRTDRVDLPDRQRSLRDNVAWSWARLDADERSWLLRLSVLSGAFGAGAAAAALGRLGPDVEVDAVLARLHRRGMLLADPESRRRPYRHLRSVVAVVRELGPAEDRAAALDRVAGYTAARAHATFAAPYLRLGPFDGDQGDDGAAAALERAVALDPSSGPVRHALCRVFGALGRWAAVEREAAAALASASDPALRTALRVTLGTSRCQCERFDAGIEVLRDGFSDPEAPAWVRCNAGLPLAFRLGFVGRVDEAGGVIRAMRSLAPEIPADLRADLLAEVVLLEAQLAGEHGDLEDAHQRYLEASRRFGELGKPALAHATLASCATPLLALGRSSEAVDLLRRAQVGLASAAGSGDDVARGFLGFVGARLALALSPADPDEAVSIGRVALDVAATPAMRQTAHLMLARVLARAGRAEEALQVLAALDRRPRTDRGWLATIRAEVLLAAGRPIDAEAAAPVLWEGASDADRWDRVEVLAEARVALGRVREAADLVDRTLAEVRPGCPPSARLCVARAEMDLAAGAADRGAARVEAILALPRDGRDVCLARGFLARNDAERAQVRDQACRLGRGTGELDAWLRVWELRAAGAPWTGPLPRWPFVAWAASRAAPA